VKMCVPITVFGLLVKDEHGRLASGLVNLLCVYGIGRHLQSAACELLEKKSDFRVGITNPNTKIIYAAFEFKRLC